MGECPGSRAVGIHIFIKFAILWGCDLWSPKTIAMVASKTTVTTNIENVIVVVMESLKHCKDY